MLTTINKIASGKHSITNVFDDFMTMSICALSIGKMEKEYEEVKRKYNADEMKLFQELFAKMIATYSERSEDGSWCDYLGEIFEQVNGEMQSSKSGQFFTPPSLCNLMSVITEDKTDLERDISVSDCACGSGRNLIAHSRLQIKNRFRTWYVAQDIDPRCIKMTVLNYVMFGMRGVVIHMDALTLEIWGGYRIWLPETLMGITPMSVNECKRYLFEQKKQKVIEVEELPMVAILESTKYSNQLSLF